MTLLPGATLGVLLLTLSRFITLAKPLMESKVRHRSFISPEDIDLLISNYTDGRLSNTSRSIRRNGKIASFIV